MVMTLLLAALVAVNLGYLLLLDRRDQRDRDERAVLLQRIQAPEQAVYEHATREQPDNGDDGMPMTDEMIADQEARDALDRIARMQAADYEGRRL